MQCQFLFRVNEKYSLRILVYYKKDFKIIYSMHWRSFIFWFHLACYSGVAVARELGGLSWVSCSTSSAAHECHDLTPLLDVHFTVATNPTIQQKWQQHCMHQWNGVVPQPNTATTTICRATANTLRLSRIFSPSLTTNSLPCLWLRSHLLTWTLSCHHFLAWHDFFFVGSTLSMAWYSDWHDLVAFWHHRFSGHELGGNFQSWSWLLSQLRFSLACVPTYPTSPLTRAHFLTLPYLNISLAPYSQLFRTHCTLHRYFHRSHL